MAENKDSFNLSLGKIDLKGKPKGITVFSKKFKMLIFVFAVVCGGIVVAATVSNWDSAAKNRSDVSKAAESSKQKLEKPRTVNFDKMYDDARPGEAMLPAPLPVAAIRPEAAGLGPEARVPAIGKDLRSTSGQVPKEGQATSTAGGPSSLFKGEESSSGMNAERGANEIKRAAEQRKQQAKMADAAVSSWGGSGHSGEPSAVGQEARDKLQSALDGLKTMATGAGAGTPQQPALQQDDVNKQAQKEAFLKAAESAPDRTVLVQTPKKPLTPYVITAGMVIPAAMGCSINTDLPGQICARVTQNVYDKVTGQYLLIPQHTEIIGTYDSRIAMGQQRILVAWSRLQYQNGEKLDIQGMPGADASGAAGFDADVDNHYGRVIGLSALASLFSAGLQLSQPNGGQSTTAGPSIGQTAAAAIGQQIGQTGSAIVQRQLQIQPTLSRDWGYKFVIQVTKDIVFQEPYRSARR